jgi:isoleucyl-tRNA synthetase
MGEDHKTEAKRAAFREVAPVPDRAAIEAAALERWDVSDVFARLRAALRGGESFSFVDGPITANNPMGVHHAWGRTLKDVIQRYHAMRGRELRWQNGFDCQGLWVEVEVEKSLGLDAKGEIEEFGLDRFARACRDRVAHFADVIISQSRRLGMWMDWGRSYYTMADANISAIWGFLARCHERGLLYRGDRLMPWCARCGTSLSQHELTDSYKELRHPSLYVSLPLRERPGESLVVWTTTPWTLPANVAAAVHPDASYLRLQTDSGVLVVAADRAADLPVAGRPDGEVLGSDLVGLTYRSPFAGLPAQREIGHRVVGWTEVSLTEGTGVVHIAPGCGAEDRDLGEREGLPVVSPVDETGRFVAEFGDLAGLSVDEASAVITARLDADGLLVRADEITHRYPVCWRCSTPLIHRLVDEWFLASGPVRDELLAAAAKVDWRPEHAGKQMAAWLENMGDWCISRRRYWGLPLPFWFCDEGHLTVIGSREEMGAKARGGTDALAELHRPWIDEVVVSCGVCDEPARRVADVGDCWLDAGIVPFSTLGWENAEAVASGYGTGAAEGLTDADLPDHAHWERWFPAEWVCEMREQVRLWFYSMLFMSVVFEGRAPYRRVLTYGRVNDEHGREMHKSWGNAIWFDDAVEKIGADTMRWIFARHDPARDLHFGFGLAEQAERRFLTLWNTYAFLVTYANLAGWAPDRRLLDEGPDPTRLDRIDRWMLARTDELVRAAREALDAADTPRFTAEVERYWTDLSGWYVRRSRRRAWAATDGGDTTVFEVLWHAVITLARCLAPAVPFVADEIWQNLVTEAVEDAPDSVHLAGYPHPRHEHADPALLREMHIVRQIAELGRAARSDAEIRIRQPLRTLLVATQDPHARQAVTDHATLLAEECNVRDVKVTDRAGEVARTEVVPEFSVLGPRHGARAQKIGRRLRDGAYTWDGGRVRVDGETLEPDEFTVRLRAKEGLALAEARGIVVALDTELDEDLLLEGRARDLVREIQDRRRRLGFDITDRIELTYPEESADVIAAHGDRIAAETLATSVRLGETLDVRKRP